MNQILLVVIALVLFVHFGGPNVPKILRDNKQLLYGIIIGLVLCSFFGLRVEGMGDDEDAFFTSDNFECVLKNHCTSSPAPASYCKCLASSPYRTLKPGQFWDEEDFGGCIHEPHKDYWHFSAIQDLMRCGCQAGAGQTDNELNILCAGISQK